MKTLRRMFLFAVLALLASGPAFGAIHTNTITGTSFVPRNMTITAGDTIVWVNVAFHSVTPSTAGEAFCGGTVFGPSVASCSATFNVPGTYIYYCIPHLGYGMSGSVTVQPVFAATTNTWTGADPSGHWSAPANWSPAGVPVNGNDLVFPGGLPPGDMASTNDLTDRIFRSIRFQAGGYTIRGNPMTLTNRSECIINSGTNVMACDLTFSGTPSTLTFGAYSIRGIGGPARELTMSGNVGGGSLYAINERLVIRGQFTGGSLRQDYGSLAFYGDHLHAVSAELRGTSFSTFRVQGSQPNLNIGMLWEMESASCPTLSGDGVVGDVTGCGYIILDSTLSVNSLGGRGASTYGWRNLDIRLNGTNVGEYGRLISSGDVTLSGASLTATPGFHPQPGQVFTIVEKTSPGPIATVPGYSTNLFGPEGKIITLNGMPFRLSYVGGDGNDVTLTAVALVPIVLGAVQRSFGTQFVFSYSTDVGLRYAVERSATLSNWTPIWSNTANANPMTFTDTAATNWMNLYRVRLLPNP